MHKQKRHTVRPRLVLSEVVAVPPPPKVEQAHEDTTYQGGAQTPEYQMSYIPDLLPSPRPRPQPQPQPQPQPRLRPRQAALQRRDPDLVPSKLAADAFKSMQEAKARVKNIDTQLEKLIQERRQIVRWVEWYSANPPLPPTTTTTS
jgi:hypothetical protein